MRGRHDCRFHPGSWHSPAMEQHAAIFDRRLLRVRRDRAARDFGAHDFLLRAAAERLLDRLLDLNRRFGTVLDLGSRTGILAGLWPDARRPATLIHADLSPDMARRAGGEGPALACDEEALPFAHGSLDGVVSCLSLHWANDLPGALVQIRRALRPDGLLLASVFGMGTLAELRDALAEAELELDGGISPRISPFADVRDLGGLMQRAGFALPVVDSDEITVTYESPFRLMHDLRGMAETNLVRQRLRRPSRSALFMRAAELYLQRHATDDGRVRATFRILTMTGWAPAPVQQAPLRPGSARVSLADALGGSGPGERG